MSENARKEAECEKTAEKTLKKVAGCTILNTTGECAGVLFGRNRKRFRDGLNAGASSTKNAPL